MKRMVTLVLALLMMTAIVPAFAEDGTLIQWIDEQYIDKTEMTLRVLRPSIILREAKKTNARGERMTFGTELELISHEGDWSYVRVVSTGNTGFVKSGYIGYVLYQIQLEGVDISPLPGMDASNFASAACGGDRSKEIGLILYEYGDYLYVVTDEGCAGWVYRYDPDIYYN